MPQWAVVYNERLKFALSVIFQDELAPQSKLLLAGAQDRLDGEKRRKGVEFWELYKKESVEIRHRDERGRFIAAKGSLSDTIGGQMDCSISRELPNPNAAGCGA